MQKMHHFLCIVATAGQPAINLKAEFIVAILEGIFNNFQKAKAQAWSPHTSKMESFETIVNDLNR